MKRWILIGAAVLLALVASFAAGRYSAPVKTVTQTKVETKTVTQTVYQDRIVEKKVQGPVRIVERVTEKPGAERVIEKWIERGPTTTDTTTDKTGETSGATETASETTKTTERERPGWAAGVAVTWDPKALALHPDRWGLELDRRLFGTLWLGARVNAHLPQNPGTQLGISARMEW